ncbi:hypothetical protein K661_03074 [Piscirickettsia salmonis LF-89 = ATCC VR-1361]|nr:hypothetical protein K661_03074 [Piscirickettsia salmonis LF-89 = ATCC VR-1361]
MTNIIEELKGTTLEKLRKFLKNQSNRGKRINNLALQWGYE